MTLWSHNTPQKFWLCHPPESPSCWDIAVRQAVPVLGLPEIPDDIETLLVQILGEGQFGPDQWTLSLPKRAYYQLKPVLPRAVTRLLRRVHSASHASFGLGWPIEDRYARFQWEAVRQLMIATGKQSLSFRYFWPNGYRFALVLTHDIEMAAGQSLVRKVADLEEQLGFRSSFNFVPERYKLDHSLMEELRLRGFEIGVHGLKHDGKLFSSQATFMRRAERINHYLSAFGAVGFRAPLMHRQPEWMQSLELEYDLSFFDTDPFEPMPGGVMTIWPYLLGRFVELPYTLVQDSTLMYVLGRPSPDVWLTKVDFIERYGGMALLNTHPDYLADGRVWRMYEEFLNAMKAREGVWNALPREVARWWKARADAETNGDPPGTVLRTVRMTAEGVEVG